ncbi:MAG: phytanoyl-CoA dioxygenase family protein [Candidatus Latescibacteria bacterium]|jgi:phytanoyl-CoA hydroxylase|nr:phytanoyl-CoA dioxygenase family protein [Candidatus Latescibacterota bacterium]
MSESEEKTGLSSEQIASFHERGYLVIGKFLDDGLIECLRTEYDREFEVARKSGGFRNLAIEDTDDVDKKNNAPTQMLQIMQMCERNIHFRRLIFHEPLLDMIECLIGPNIQLFHDQALYKPAHTGGEIFWHQDNAYWQCTPPNLVSCWMTLDDVTIDNGAMQLIPGSHLKALDHTRTGEGGPLLDVRDQATGQDTAVIDLPAGGVMIHHCQTMHYTQPNNTDRQRRAFAIHYMTPGTRNLRKEEHLEVGFERPMLRMKI